MVDLNFDSSKIKDMLYLEEKRTIRNQYDNFMNDNFDSEDVNVEELYPIFETFLQTLNKGNLKRIVKPNNSFLYQIMSLKQNARERELRRLTLEFSDFIGQVGHERKEPILSFAEDLKCVASEINARENKGDKQSMSDAWKNMLHNELISRFK